MTERYIVTEPGVTERDGNGLGGTVSGDGMVRGDVAARLNRSALFVRRWQDSDPNQTL